jgi:O-acetyl-ADP-ribose deacetylase (regulator of RNase III)
MIKIVKGDLLKAKENIIAHQVNCMGVMGSGVAKQIRNKYPNVYEEYLEKVDEYTQGEDLRKELLGQVQGVVVGEDKIVVNMFGQYKFGNDGKQYTDTEALFKCLLAVRQVAEKNKISVAMPYKIGSYRSGAKWDEVEELILKAFDGYEVTLYKL